MLRAVPPRSDLHTLIAEITVARRGGSVDQQGTRGRLRAHKAEGVQTKPWTSNTHREPRARFRPFDKMGKAICEAVANQTERGQRSFLGWLVLTSSDKKEAMARSSRKQTTDRGKSMSSVSGPCSTDLSDTPALLFLRLDVTEPLAIIPWPSVL